MTAAVLTSATAGAGSGLEGADEAGAAGALTVAGGEGAGPAGTAGAGLLRETTWAVRIWGAGELADGEGADGEVAGEGDEKD